MNRVSTMKSLWIITITIVMGLYPFNFLHAQTTANTVHQLYFQSVAFPEEFDYSPELLEAAGLMKNEVMGCLVSLRNNYYQLAQAAIRQCEDAYPGNPEGHWQCIKDDTNASMAYWSNGMIGVAITKHYLSAKCQFLVLKSN